MHEIETNLSDEELERVEGGACGFLVLTIGGTFSLDLCGGVFANLAPLRSSLASHQATDVGSVPSA